MWSAISPGTRTARISWTGGYSPGSKGIKRELDKKTLLSPLERPFTYPPATLPNLVEGSTQQLRGLLLSLSRREVDAHPTPTQVPQAQI
jgi:hypothetical protein